MMNGLFDPTRHEPLQALPWDEAATNLRLQPALQSRVIAFSFGRTLPIGSTPPKGSETYDPSGRSSR